jgi:hypothetical protein
VGKIRRRIVGLTAEEVGITLAEGKDLLGELGRMVLHTQMEEYTTCAHVCPGCMKLGRQRDSRRGGAARRAGLDCHRSAHDH